MEWHSFCPSKNRYPLDLSDYFMDLINFLRVLARRIWLILGVTALAVLVTWLVTRNAPDMYKSTALISTGITQSNQLDDKQWYQWEIATNNFNNLIEDMNSRQAISLLSYRLIQHDLSSGKPYRDLSKVKTYYEGDQLNQAKRVYQAKYDDIETLYPTRKSDAIPIEILKRSEYDYMNLAQNLEIFRQKQSDYISVSFKSDDPFLSEFAVNTFAEEFIRYNRNRVGSGSSEQVDNLRKIMNTKQDSMEARSRELAALEQKYGIVDQAENSKIIAQTTSDYTRMRDNERSKVAALEAELSEINRQLASPESNTAANQVKSNAAEIDRLTRILSSLKMEQSLSPRASLQDSIAQFEQQKSELLSRSSTTFGGGNDSRSSLLKKKTDKELELSNAKAKLASIEKNLNREIGKRYNMVSGNPEVKRAYTTFEQAEKEYLAAQTRYNDALNKTQSIGKDLQIFERGRAADEPEPSKAPLLIAFSGLASLSLCIVLLFLLEYVDLSVRTPSNFVRLSGLPLLGSLNHLTTSSLKLESLFSEKSNNPSLERFKQLLRKLRYELLNTNAKTVLFTSARPGEGKTLGLISLAYSLSLNDKKILLIDSNFKSPSLTGMLQASPVLEEVVRQGADPAKAVSRSEFTGIDVIGCKGGDYSPAEVLYDDRFSAMLEELSHNYDYIFMEGAPLNNFADAKELVHFVDKVVAVFSAKSVLKQSDKETIAYLQGLDDKFLGAILNDVEVQNLEL